ncbi:MAG: hypothetical protein RIC35_03560 [Marinoscillum sp.]
MFLLLHPYHVSVCEVVYNDEVQAIQITQRIFLDDFEDALTDFTQNDDLVLLEDSLQSHKAIERYFQKNFGMVVNGKKSNYTYLGSESEDDIIWCYLEVTNIHSLQSIELKNTVLTEIFDDQKNLVHFKIAGEKKSFILTKSDITASY